MVSMVESVLKNLRGLELSNGLDQEQFLCYGAWDE